MVFLRGGTFLHKGSFIKKNSEGGKGDPGGGVAGGAPKAGAVGVSLVSKGGRIHGSLIEECCQGLGGGQNALCFFFPVGGCFSFSIKTKGGGAPPSVRAGEGGGGGGGGTPGSARIFSKFSIKLRNVNFGRVFGRGCGAQKGGGTGDRGRGQIGGDLLLGVNGGE